MNNYELKHDLETSLWFYRGVALEKEVSKQNLISLLPILENDLYNFCTIYPNFPYLKNLFIFALETDDEYWIRLSIHGIISSNFMFDEDINNKFNLLADNRKYSRVIREKIRKIQLNWKYQKEEKEYLAKHLFLNSTSK